MASRGIFRLVMAAVIGLAIVVPQSAEAETGAGERVHLEALGAASAIALYNSHLIVGLSGEAMHAGSMTETQTLRALGEQRNMMMALAPYVDKLLDEGQLLPADAASLQEIRACVKSIVQMANALEEYIGEKSEENAVIFNEAREASYAAIAHLLGIDQPSSSGKS